MSTVRWQGQDEWLPADWRILERVSLPPLIKTLDRTLEFEEALIYRDLICTSSFPSARRSIEARP